MSCQVKILAIETSCDETAVAVVQEGQKVLANIVSSQVKLHEQYGGVVPEVASRAHAEIFNILLEEVLKQADVSWAEINAIAVTYGPGLIGALLVGLSAAKTISFTKNIPLIGVNHMEGHIYANILENGKNSLTELPFPFICLIVSGGHTQIVYIPKEGTYEIVGQTQDDSVGEAFDKVARVLELGYPVGPIIDKVSNEGNSQAIPFPKLYTEGGLNFSFSGIKTAVIHWIQKNGKENVADIAASFQKTVVDSLVQKTIKAAKKKKVSRIFLAGGVSANTHLRQEMKNKAKEIGMKVYYPPLKYCTDNAAMIAAAAYPKLIKKEFSPLTIEAKANLML
ncbi:MAG: tRNA (adenosine(37)-N6)-threonylcarbamoyltransferase complex transferase subunit TsaD [Candidatus Margulisbacteria bacterium]|nr:tRNA (adenosine(37)-N6)-threonylcarbamoyltransferase complex transferase subunit TsaD [Candidatus Margulisiibacteriota bacterium]